MPGVCCWPWRGSAGDGPFPSAPRRDPFPSTEPGLVPHNVVPVPCNVGWCPVMWAGALNMPEGAVIPRGLAPLTTHRFIRSAIYLPCQALALTCAKEEKHLCPTAAPGLQSCFVTLLARCDPSAERRRRAAAPLRAAVRGSAAAATLQGYRVCWCQLSPAFPPHIPERRSQAWMSRPCPPYSLFFFFSPPQRVVFGLNVADLGAAIPPSTPGCQLLFVRVLEPLCALGAWRCVPVAA